VVISKADREQADSQEAKVAVLSLSSQATPQARLRPASPHQSRRSTVGAPIDRGVRRSSNKLRFSTQNRLAAAFGKDHV
jgi:hypothetical protein